MSWLALDIGGANLKAADGCGWTYSQPFALWLNPQGLANAVAAAMQVAPDAERIAVTMTGELCDCFETKDDGVRQIVAAVQSAAGGREVRVYLVDGRLVSGEQACESARLAAASNWHALAHYACRFVQNNPAILIDIGSTTTDIVPLIDGRPCPVGFNDTDRLVAGELVYTGVGRTQICALTSWLPWHGKRCPVATELFATTADAYLMLECVSEQADAAWTADARPLTKQNSRARLARMICADTSSFSETDAIAAAACIRELQLAQLQQAVCQVASRLRCQPDGFVISGRGEFLAEMLVRTAVGPAVISLSEQLGSGVSVVATAHALAVLALEAGK